MDYIFDIDDTISDSSNRHSLITSTPKNWNLYYAKLVEDAPIEPVVAILKSLHQAQHRIILCTGRPEQYRATTIEWLKMYSIPYTALYMRTKSGAYLRNAEIKKILLEAIRADGYNPLAVFEDNPLSVEMWQQAGLRTLQICSLK